MSGTPFDLSGMHSALPPLQSQSPISAQSPSVLSPGINSPSPAPWAADFLQRQPIQSPLPQVLRADADQSSAALHQNMHTPLEASGMSSPFQGEIHSVKLRGVLVSRNAARTQWAPTTLGFTNQMGSMSYQSYVPSIQTKQPVPAVNGMCQTSLPAKEYI
jgi:hypothetical protein